MTVAIERCTRRVRYHVTARAATTAATSATPMETSIAEANASSTCRLSGAPAGTPARRQVLVEQPGSDGGGDQPGRSPACGEHQRFGHQQPEPEPRGAPRS